MIEVNTVLCPVPVSQFGLVLMHEHAFACIPGWEMDARNAYDREGDLESVSRQLAALLEHGVKTIVDATPVDIGRNVEFIVEVSQRSGANIIASTGLRMTGSAFITFKLRS